VIQEPIEIAPPKPIKKAKKGKIIVKKVSPLNDGKVYPSSI
jgi:hypothetical protein